MNRISWLIPTYNEEKTIRRVIEQIPVGVPYVFDKSSDNTAKIAKDAGAIVVPRKGVGKGDAMREAFDYLMPLSDVIITIDGDNTYSPIEVFTLLDEIENGVDMVIGSRFLGSIQNDAMSRLNSIGNRIINFILNLFFPSGSEITDSLSGFRAIRISSLKDINLTSKQFEIEVELTARFLKKKFKVVEKPISYRRRPEGSQSKLRPVNDGLINIKMILEVKFEGALNKCTRLWRKVSNK